MHGGNQAAIGDATNNCATGNIHPHKPAGDCAAVVDAAGNIAMAVNSDAGFRGNQAAVANAARQL